LLSTLADHAQYIPDNAILHLLEVRALFIPAVACAVAAAIADCFAQGRRLTETTGAYAVFDWQWQVLATRLSGNPFFPLILNDFAAVFKKAGIRYFGESAARAASKSFYQQVHQAIIHREKSIQALVEAALRKSIQIWQELET